jgi:Flp pilus assembly protein TadG
MFKPRSHQNGQKPARKGLLRRLRADTSGATAIEFGIVAAPFFALMLALIEVSLVFFANFTLENAVDQASRMIRTGQAQQQGFSEAQFKQTVCDHVSGVYDCMSGLKLDVQKFDDFSGINLPDPLDGDGELRSDFSYDAGAGGDVVVVRAFYEWNLVANFPGGLGNMPGGGRLLVATAAFRNEPFDD